MVPDLDKVVALAYHATDAPLTLSENLGLRLLQHHQIDDNLETETGTIFLEILQMRVKIYRIYQVEHGNALTSFLAKCCIVSHSVNNDTFI